MSGAIEVAEMAPKVILELLTDMFAGDYPNNEVLLGVLKSGNDRIQVQLKITREPTEFMDE